MTSIYAWSSTDGNRLASTVGLYLKNAQQYTPEEFVAAAEQAAKQFPSEWVVFYTLCDNYQAVQRYADALKACNTAYNLRPNDIRSVYALGTEYNLLTRAAWSQAESDAARALKIDPTKEKQLADIALKQAGMTAQTAASRAIALFEQVLTLNPDPDSKNTVQQDLNTLYRRFPSH